MASDNAAAAFSPPPPPSLDDIFINRFMEQLRLRSPYFDSDLFLSHRSAADNDDDDDEEDPILAIDTSDGRRETLAREEAKLERDISRIIHSGDAAETLKVNSGHSAAIGEHTVCVCCHVDPTSEYRVWEWHGHIMFFDEPEGLSAEYIYGNYFERLPPKETKEEREFEGEASSGLKDLIEVRKDPAMAGVGGGRVLHRNRLNAGSSCGFCRYVSKVEPSQEESVDDCLYLP